MRPTTKRRLLILSVTLLVLVGGVGGFAVIRISQINRTLQQNRTDGMAAFDSGDYAKAMELLSNYVGKNKTDTDALYELAVARSQIPLPNGQHMKTAISYLNNFLDLRKGPSQGTHTLIEGQHKLLDLYMRVRYKPETLALANEILLSSPTDLPALRAKANALTGQHNFADALVVSQKINDLAPFDLDSQQLTYSLLAQLNHSKPELIARAKAGMDAHPQDPRFELLAASASSYAGDQATAQQFLMTAVARKAPDVDFVRLATKLLDSGESYDLSQKLLERAVVDLNDPAVLQMLVERLWESGQFDEMAKRLESVKADDPKANTNLLAMKAISLLEHDQPADAVAVVKVLASRAVDDEAFAWSSAIPAKYAVPAPDARSAVQSLFSAANRDRDNSVIRLWLGDAYAKLGENELAVNSWHMASTLAPAWAEPHVRAAKALALSGRGQEAYEESRLAADRTPTAVQTRVAVAMALSSLSSDDPKAVSGAQLLRLATAIQTDSPNEPQTLPMYVALLTQNGQRDKAIATIKAALAASPALPADTLLRIASVAGELKLDQQQAVYDAMAQAGDKSPELALAQAKMLLGQGHGDQAAALMKSAATPSDPAAWQLATAKYLEFAQDPSATAAWKALAAQYPNDLRVQSAFLKSSARTEDRAAWAASIERLKNLTLEEGVAWRTEQAKYLLNGQPSDKDRADGVTLLNDLIRSNPDLAEPRVLLASALLQSGNSASAIEQLKIAAQLRPKDPQIALSLAKLLLDAGKSVEGEAYLDKLADSGQLTPAGLAVVAQLMADQGQVNRAIQMLQAAPGNDPNRDVLQAQFYRRLGKAQEAAALFDKIAKATPITTQAISKAAEYYYSLGQHDQAKAVLARLPESADPPAPGTAELLKAQLSEQFEPGPAVKDLYAAAVQASPDVRTYRAQASYDIRQYNFADAKAALTQAMELAKQDPEIAALIRLCDQGVALPTGVDVYPEMMILSRDPLNPAAQELLAAGIDSTNAHESADDRVTRFKPIADKYSKSWLADQRLIQAYIDAGQLDRARQACLLAANTFPNDPGPLQLACAVYSAQSDWTAELAAAQQWHARALENPRACDLAAGEALVGLRQNREAIATIKPYVAEGMKNVPASLDVFWPYCSALLQDGRDAEASEILLESAKTQDSVRKLWLALAGLVGPNSATATAWIEKIVPLLDGASNDDQSALAHAWFMVAQRYNDAAVFTKANNLLKTMADKNPGDASLWAQLGEGLRNANDLDGAEAAFRQAIAHGDTTYSTNALAFLLLTQDKNADEALTFSNKAIDSAPRVAGYYDTRGQIYLRMKKFDLAVKDFDRALAIQPTLVDSMVGKADALNKAGQHTKSVELIKYIDTLVTRPADLSVYTRKQLADLKVATAN